MNLAHMLWPAILLGQQMSTAQDAAPVVPLVPTAGGATVWLTLGALVCGVVALCLLLPATTGHRHLAGAALGSLSVLLILSGVLLPLAPWSAQCVFWALATVTIVAAAAAIATVKPVYTALWFALSLLGTAGLLFFDGAQFLERIHHDGLCRRHRRDVSVRDHVGPAGGPCVRTIALRGVGTPNRWRRSWRPCSWES